MVITFTDFYGDTRSGEIQKTGFISEQKWHAVSVKGINWLVPEGWPNNATAICEEEYPAEYAEMMAQL